MDKGLTESVRQRLQQKQDDIWRAHDDQPTPELFHYTSAEGFRGIIETRQFWCTDVSHVKDDREGDHGLSILKSVLNRKYVYEPFREFVGDLDSLFGMKRQWTSYMCCFCSAGEQAHMWRDYAKGGTGCALVFDYDALYSGANGGKRYAFFRVLYDQELQTRQVEQTVDHAIQFEQELGISGTEHRKRYWEEVEFALLTCALRFKHPKLTSEAEVRLWIAEGPDATPFEAFGKPRVSVDFKASSLTRVIRGAPLGITSVPIGSKTY